MTTARARCVFVGHGPALRVENRVGGGDLNPYLAVAAMLAGGLHGIEQQLPLEPALRGQRLRVSDQPPGPCLTLQEARRPAPRGLGRWRGPAFGDEVVDHYVNAADVEINAFNAAVTDWERRRGFERL